MAKKIIRKNKLDGSTKDKFTKINPIELAEITPTENYIVKLSCEDTKFLVTFKNEQVVQCTALDGTYETITIPISQFNRGKYSFEHEEDGKSKKHTAEIELFIQN